MLQNEIADGFKEKIEGKIKLPDQTVRSFDIYIKYVYHGKLFTKVAQTLDTSSSKPDVQEYTTLFALVILADYLQSDTFHNAVIEAIIQAFNGYNTFPTTS
jgi:hypothetical protein